MSSSTSTPDDFAALVARSLDLLHQEHRPASVELHARLSGQRLGLEVDGERFSLISHEGRARLAWDEGLSTVRLRTTRAALLKLLEGRDTLLDAALHERLMLWGTAGDLARFLDALTTWLQGAVRCPSFPALFEDLRRQHAVRLANPAHAPGARHEP